MIKNTVEDLNLDPVDHIALQVLDVAQAVAWYKDHFKCNVNYQDETWAFIQFANINLALVVPNQHPAHLAFKLENASKYGALKTHRDGTKSLYLSDPAGNTIELMDESPDIL